MQTTIEVEEHKCKRDGLCVRVCPMRLFQAEPKQVPKAPNAHECVLCGQCLAVCSADALRHSRLDPSRFQQISSKEQLDPEAVVRLLSARRSVRNYRDKPVPRDLLEKLLNVCGYAPGSPHGGIGWERCVTVLSGREQMDRARDFAADYMRECIRFLGSWYMRLCGYFSAELTSVQKLVIPDMQMRLAELAAGRDAIIYEAPAAVFFHAPKNSVEPQVDCDAACLAFMYAAQAYGLGTCWNGLLGRGAAGYGLRGFTAFRSWLGIPNDHNVFAATTVGYPSVTLHSLPHRETVIRWVEPAPEQAA